MPSKKIKTKPLSPKQLTRRGLPASVGLVEEVRDELKAEIGVFRHEVKAEIGAFRHEIKAEMHSLRHELRGEIQQVLVIAHRTQAIVEEQRSENRIVLDGLKNLGERQDRVEEEIILNQDFLRTLRKAMASAT